SLIDAVVLGRQLEILDRQERPGRGTPGDVDGGRPGHREQPAPYRAPAGVVASGPPAEPDESLLHHLFGQPLVVKDMDAEPEQLHAVLAVQPSGRVVVVPGGDLGNQAYLMRTSSCSAITPRHSPTRPYRV